MPPQGTSFRDFCDALVGAEVVPLPVDDIYFWLDYYESYLAAMERFLEETFFTIQEHYREGSQETDWEVQQWLESQAEENGEVYVSILRRSFFVAIYSLVEVELDDRCRLVEGRSRLPSSLNDLEGQGIERAREYLVKVAGISFPNSKEWQELTNYAKLRNCVVHSQGRLTGRHAKYLREKYIPRQPCLAVEDFGYGEEVIFHRGFCEEVIKTVRVFFQQLDAARHGM